MNTWASRNKHRSSFCAYCLKRLVVSNLYPICSHVFFFTAHCTASKTKPKLKYAPGTVLCMLRMRLFPSAHWPLFSVYVRISKAHLFCKQPSKVSELAFDLFSTALTAANHAALMGEGSHSDQISETHLRDKKGFSRPPSWGMPIRGYTFNV